MCIVPIVAALGRVVGQRVPAQVSYVAVDDWTCQESWLEFTPVLDKVGQGQHCEGNAEDEGQGYKGDLGATAGVTCEPEVVHYCGCQRYHPEESGEEEE